MDDASRPFKVISGGGGEASPPDWLVLPNLLLSKSPFNKEKKALFRVSRDYINASLAANRRQPMLDFWGCVHGRIPPIANIGAFREEHWDKRLHSISDAHACFRGLKRPVGQDDNGWDYVAYITKPEWSFHSQRSLVACARISRVPDDLVFVTYVRLDKPRDADDDPQSLGIPVLGVVTHWEFVETDRRDVMLPIDHATRYRRRLW